MAETFAVVIHPSAVGAPDLRVRDAMQQVLDLIELLEAADSGDQNGKVVWLLKSASTNSPLRVEAEGVSPDPSISAAPRAILAERRFAAGIVSMVEEEQAPPWMDDHILQVASRVFERVLQNIGRMDLHLPAVGDPILVVPRNAQRGLVAAEKAIVKTKKVQADQSRTEFGTIEAVILAASTYYGRPSLVLKERLSNDKTTCVLSTDLASRVGSEHHLSDVWNGQRVRVSGAINYNRNGSIEKVDATYIEAVNSREISLTEMRNLNITSGLEPTQFIRLVRGDDTG